MLPKWEPNWDHYINQTGEYMQKYVMPYFSTQFLEIYEVFFDWLNATGFVLHCQ